MDKEDIFYYIYGYLHSPEYREMFSDDLKLSLPHIGFVDSYNDFKTFSDAGRRLANLHTRYEDVEPYKGVTIKGFINESDILNNSDICKVRKMKLDVDKRKLVYNERIIIENIPEEAFEYVINGRSAIAWIVNQYQIDIDTESGIVNDPNEYAGSSYILRLLLSVINVSVQTMEIVKSLPSIGLSDSEGEKNIS